jgi:hypothetical protein
MRRGARGRWSRPLFCMAKRSRSRVWSSANSGVSDSSGTLTYQPEDLLGRGGGQLPDLRPHLGHGAGVRAVDPGQGGLGIRQKLAEGGDFLLLGGLGQGEPGLGQRRRAARARHRDSGAAKVVYRKEAVRRPSTIRSLASAWPSRSRARKTRSRCRSFSGTCAGAGPRRKRPAPAGCRGWPWPAATARPRWGRGRAGCGGCLQVPGHRLHRGLAGPGLGLAPHGAEAQGPVQVQGDLVQVRLELAVVADHEIRAQPQADAHAGEGSVQLLEQLGGDAHPAGGQPLVRDPLVGGQCVLALQHVFGEGPLVPARKT